MIIVYRGADQVSQVSNELAGSFYYYADAEDAFEFHKFVERLIVPEMSSNRDYLGKKFKNAQNRAKTQGDRKCRP